MAINTSGGAKFYIGPVNSTAEDESDYAGLSYVEVGGVDAV